MQIFQNLNESQKITIIVVTHSEEVARFCHRIITFRDGRIVGEREDGRIRPLSIGSSQVEAAL